MKLTFLGTGAADWRAEHKKTHGAEYRRYASILINNDLLIDPGPMIFEIADDLNINLKAVENILITHTHPDHFSPETLMRLHAIGGHNYIWGNKDCINSGNMLKLNDILAFFSIEPSLPIRIGNYQVIPVKANHFIDSVYEEQAYHYIISEGSKTIFYGCDGAWLFNEAWQEIRKHHFDAIILDTTFGDVVDGRIFAHNNLKMVLLMVEAFKKSNIIKETGKVYVTHLARSAHKSHAQLQADMTPYGIQVAYDGMVVNLDEQAE